MNNNNERRKEKKASEYTEDELMDELVLSKGGILKGRFRWDQRPRSGVEGIEERRIPFPFEPIKGPQRPVREHELALLKERLDAVNEDIEEKSEGMSAWENQEELGRLDALREHLHARMGDLCEDSEAYESESAEWNTPHEVGDEWDPGDSGSSEGFDGGE